MPILLRRFIIRKRPSCLSGFLLPSRLDAWIGCIKNRHSTSEAGLGEIVHLPRIIVEEQLHNGHTLQRVQFPICSPGSIRWPLDSRLYAKQFSLCGMKPLRQIRQQRNVSIRCYELWISMPLSVTRSSSLSWNSILRIRLHSKLLLVATFSNTVEK